MSCVICKNVKTDTIACSESGGLDCFRRAFLRTSTQLMKAERRIFELEKKLEELVKNTHGHIVPFWGK